MDAEREDHYNKNLLECRFYADISETIHDISYPFLRILGQAC